MHLPDEHFGAVNGGEALATDAGEPNGVAFVEQTRIFEFDASAGHEQGCVYGASGTVTASVNCMRAACSAAWRFLMRMATPGGVLVHARRHRDEPTP